MPPGGAPRGAGARRADANPGAMRALRRLVVVPPRHLEVTLADSMVTVGYAPDEVWVLPFGETVKREDGDLEYEVKAEWENERLRITRKVSGAGSVTELYTPAVDGTKLTVEVDASLGGPGGVELQRVYDAESGRRH